jgi:hypothetical protein
MSWFVLSGRNVGFRIGKWAPDFEATVPVIRDVLYGLGDATSVPPGVTILTNPCFLNEVDIDMSAGVNPIVALGVENIASLEEFIVRAQNVRTRFTVQSQQAGATSGPIDFVHNLISGATRLGTSVGANTYHLPPYFLDFFVVAPPVGILGPPVKVWRLSAPFAFIRNLRWTQRPEDAAQLEITWFVPYIFFGDVGTSVPTLSSYDASAGVLIVREAVFDIASEEAGGTDNVLDLNAFQSQRIVTDFSIEINNDLREVYTASLPSDMAAANEAVRRTLRVFNAIFEGRSTITSSFTVIYPGGLKGSLNLAMPQVLKKISFTYYESAGAGATEPPVPVYSLILRHAKVLDSRLALATEQQIVLTTNVQAMDIEAVLRPS